MLLALIYLHQRGILHRDLKPNNALVVNGDLKLLDFGLSVITGRAREHHTYSTVGTMAYMAPEIFEGGAYSQSSDLYAAGMIAFQLFAGVFPFNDKNMATLIHEILGKPVDAAEFGVNERLTPVLNKLLAKSRSDRYQDAAEVLHDLSRALKIPQPRESVEIRESFLQTARFVGREKELLALKEHLKSTIAGKGSSILIGGESGVGKSRLLDEVRIIALIGGTLVVRGQDISDGRSPYQLWQDVLRSLALYSEVDNESAGILKEIIPDIGRTLGRDVPDAPLVSLQEVRSRLHMAVRRIIEKLDRPAVLLLEDIHWSGNESIQLLKEVAVESAAKPLLVIATYRDDEPWPYWVEVAHLETMSLQRLTMDDTAELSASILGDPGSGPELVSLLQRETEGNAFFLLEAVRSLADEAGELRTISGDKLPENILTGGMQAILDRRLERVPAAARPLLELASVAGRVLDLDLLRVLKPEFDLESWLSVCTDVAVLEADGETWRFGHDKLREAIRDQLSHDRHHTLHFQVAEAIESLYPDAPEYAAALTHHWTVAGNNDKALRYAELADRQAARNSAYEEAITYLNRALDLLRRRPDSEARSRQELTLLLELGPPRWAT